MNRLRHSHRSSKLLAGLMATAALTAVSVLAAPAQGARSPSPTAAQAGCLLKSLSLRTIHVDTDQQPSAGPASSRAHASRIARIMIFKSSIQCTGNTSWKVTMQIRRRRFGPDKSVAYKQFKGSGSKRFVIGADCKKGQRFNGNFTINFLGAGQSASRVVKNKECD